MPDGGVTVDHVDVLIVGAGLSGIGAGYYLQDRCPNKTYAILEAREASGGTWDLFRYPGIRSDSDMYTLGYRFRPWRQAKTIADGPSILEYVRETAEHYGVDKHIRYDHKVVDVAWSSSEGRYTVTAMRAGAPVRITCNFVWMCAGYYRYESGYTPDFPGADKFAGDIIHPQNWPENFDYSGKRVVVIGSGATAVTLIPSMAEKAAHITMLQRSPTYMYAMPAESPFANFLRKFLPDSITFKIMRWQRIILQQYVYRLARARPQKMADELINLTREKLPKGYDVETHFTPRYNPWEQRLCLVPDDDLFESIAKGDASVATGEIERFTPSGILLKSGEEIEADIIITATGLALELFGGATVSVDGEKIDFGKTLTYKGLMYSGVPNLASIFGYTNASWTLRSDLISEYFCRLINYMDKHGFTSATPRNYDPGMKTSPFLDFSSGYVRRAEQLLPRQGEHAPWRHPQSYFRDIFDLRFGSLADDAMEFESAPSRQSASASEKEKVAA